MLLLSLVSFIAALVVPLLLTVFGVPSRRVGVVCLTTAGIGFCFAALFVQVELGPHIEVAGWMVGGVFAILLLLSCGLCLACRRLFRQKPDNKNANDV